MFVIRSLERLDLRRPRAKWRAGSEASYMLLAPTYKGEILNPLKLIGIYGLSISVDREQWQKCYYTNVCFSSCIDFRNSLLSRGESS